MKTKRVGSISMALVLIAFGVVLLISQFSTLSAVELSVKLWPGILILLGLEILYCSYRRQKDKEDLIIKYDVFSIFIVTVILFVNVCLYGLMETGVLDLIKLRVSEETLRYEMQLQDEYKWYRGT
ncbi:MAG: LiaF transmembrane domain-containing protein [Tissierellaceae bacterium]|jgi:hypothetical protein|nr:hypothetical protein [Tissierellia bacterium]